MPKTKTIQYSLGGGEVAPSLYGRFDLRQYNTFCKTMKNMYSAPHGGAYNRPGTKYVGTSLGDGMLIPFKVTATQSYVLLFTALKMKVIKDGAFVQSGGSDLQVTSPYAFADLAKLSFAQSVDTLYITHPDYAPRTLTRTSDTAWTFATITFGTTVTAPGDLFARALYFSGSNNVNRLYAATSVDANGQESLLSNAYDVNTNTPWSSGALIDLCAGATQTWTQSPAQALEYYLVGSATYARPTTKPESVWVRDGSFIYTQATEGTIGSLGTNEWAWGDNDSLGYNTIYVNFSAGDDPDSTGVYAVCWLPSGAKQVNWYKKTTQAWGLIGTTSAPGFIDNNIAEDVTFGPQTDSGLFASTNNYPGSVSIYQQRLMFARTTNNPQNIWLSRPGLFTNFNESQVPGADDPIIKTVYTGFAEEIRHIVSQQELIILTENSAHVLVQGDNSDTLTRANANLRKKNNVGASYVRPVVASNTVLYVTRDGKHIVDLAYTARPDEFVGVGSYSGADLTLYAPHLFLESTIKELSFQESPNRTLWTVMNDGSLYSMTFLKEQNLYAWSQHNTDGLFKSVATINSDNAEDDTYFLVRRTINGSVVHYVEKLNTRNFAYAEDGYFVDCGVTNNNPTTITGITQASPAVVTTDGAHGWSADQKIYIRAVDGMTEVNGSWYLVKSPTSTTFQLYDLDGNEIDATSYSKYVTGGEAHPAVTSISGLTHLEGEAVAICKDGEYIGTATVASGVAAFPSSNSFGAIVHAGLPYTSILEMLPIQNTELGSAHGMVKQVEKVALLLEQTKGGSVGTSSSNALPMKYRKDEEYNEPTAIRTGWKEMRVQSGVGLNTSLYIQQTDPLPFSILAVSYRLSVSET